MTSTLEPAGPEMRRLVELAVDRIVAHIESLPSQPSVDVEGGVELARSLSEPLPETPTPYAQLLDLLFERAVPKSFNTAGPGYLAYIPGGGLFHTALADLIADAVNRYVGVWAAAPALVQPRVEPGEALRPLRTRPRWRVGRGEAHGRVDQPHRCTADIVHSGHCGADRHLGR